MTQSQRFLIAGCGGVGVALGRRLVEAGHVVWGLRRSAAALPHGIRTLQADLADPRTLESLPEVDGVFFTASADARTEEAYRQAYVAGLRNLIDALRSQSAAPQRLLFTSSTAVYGEDDGSWVDEQTATRPTRFTGEILLEAERVALDASWSSSVVRLAGIYGAGRFGFVKRVYAGEKALTGRYTNRIHVEDCGGVLAHLALINAPDDVYVGVDDAPVTEIEVGSWMAERLGVTANVSEEPNESLNKRCRNRRIRDAGYEFAFPTYREGYASIVEAFLAGREGA